MNASVPSKEFIVGAVVASCAIAGLIIIAACTDSSQKTQQASSQPRDGSTSGASIDPSSQQSNTNLPGGGSTTPVPSGPSTSRSGSIFDTSTTPSPEESASAWRDGVALFDTKHYADAAEKLRIAALGRPDNAYRCYLLGLALWKSGQPQPAEEALVRSTTLRSESSKSWINLARVRMDLKDPRGALDASDEALKIDSQSRDALHQRGRALAGLERTDEAIETLHLALEAAPGDGYVANTLGWLLIRTGRPEEAVPYLETASQALPGIAYVHNNLGVAYERTGQVDKAMAEYRSAMEAGDSDGKAQASLGRLESSHPEFVVKGTPGTVKSAPIAQTVDGDGTSNSTPEPNH